jgi:hypothetical protein
LAGSPVNTGWGTIAKGSLIAGRSFLKDDIGECIRVASCGSESEYSTF